MNISRFRELIRLGVPHPFPYVEGGGKGAPAPPDYRGAAEEQSAASREIATAQTWANRPTINTPWGQQTWQAGAGVDPSTGTPITNWTQNVNLTPEQQSALDAQQRITAGRSGAAETLLGQATSAFQTPFDWQGLPEKGRAQGPTTQTTNEAGFTDERRRIEEGLFARMAPQHQAAEEQLRTRLANMGLDESSAAGQAEVQKLREAQAGERFNAMQMGGAEQARNQQMVLGQQQQAFGQGGAFATQAAQLRNQAISEEAQRRGMTLNELNALLTQQQVTMPTGFASAPPTGASAGQAPNYLGAAQAQGDFMTANKKEGADIGSAIGGIASMAAMFSDHRLKANIRRIGTHPVGVGIYSYLLFGRPEVGVMAQELLHVRPDLVFMHPSGYLMVNYGELQ